MKKVLSFMTAGVMAAGMALSTAAASDWPNRPVTLIVAAGAGGGTDATARWLASGLEQKFGQPFNVVNRAEGGGIAGITELANAEEDYERKRALRERGVTAQAVVDDAKARRDAAAQARGRR